MAGADREPSRQWYRRWLETTWQVERPLVQTLAETPDDARIVDVGAGGRRVRPNVTTVDVLDGPDVDVVADSHSLPFEDNSYDLAICTGTLNLCQDPQRVLSELGRVLKPGGIIHLEVGMFQPYNPEPEDYWRFTLAGLRLLHERAGFVERRSGSHIGPMAALVTSGTYLTGRLFEGPSVLQRGLRGASHAVLGPLKYLDGLIPTDKMARTPFAYGIYYVGAFSPSTGS